MIRFLDEFEAARAVLEDKLHGEADARHASTDDEDVDVMAHGEIWVWFERERQSVDMN